ncbi:MAG TPA: UDP-N-acetylglucosamine 2-epimerase (non-hydrolyzing) [Ornithinibacter sp.]|nr:UDP-N-acetylglucosamine 2-epimerase (non-hydrolyzing) [Ornithinibacter sp.]
MSGTVPTVAPDEPSSPRKVLLVVGTRPEAIKMLPIVAALRQSRHLDPVVVATGQHPGVVEDVLALAGERPDVDLGVGGRGLTLNGLVSAVMTSFERFLVERFGETAPAAPERDDAYPTACVVHGDTSSAMAAAVSAFHLQIPVVHVEAGLRTGDIREPYPEELNRQIISRIAALHLAPTDLNAEHLIREGVPNARIFVCGNTAIDALAWAARLRVPYGQPALADLEDDESIRVVTVTAHRRENWGGGLARIATAVGSLAEHYPDVRFVLPLHPNPVVAESLRSRLEGHHNVSLVEPMSYAAFARLLARSHFAISDSGGVQEEAPAMGTPVLVTRASTERQEGVAAGTLELVGTNVDRIVTAARRLLDDPQAHATMAGCTNPYGDGHTAQRIVACFEHIAFDGPAPTPFGSGYDRLAVLRAGGFDEGPGAVGATTMADRLQMPDTHEEVMADVDVT